MQHLRIAIVEDEMIIAGDIYDFILEFGYEPCEIASSYEEAIKIATEQKPDLFLLDITLKDSKSGIDIANTLQELRIPFIFITSHADSNYITAAKETRPYGYLIKPFTKQDLFAAIEMAASHVKHHPLTSSLFIPMGKGKQRVALKEIIFVKANGNYVELQIQTRRIALRKNLKEFEAKLPLSHTFVRVHKSYLVNRKHIVSYNQMELNLSDQTKIPIGRTFYNDLRYALGVA